jgi:Pin2-interacting protein X1
LQVAKKNNESPTTHATSPGKTVRLSIPLYFRNTNSHPDAAKFGQTYLAKFGWDESQGLGASGSGRTSHIKVSQKLDMLGIGAANQRDPNGIAWKQNKDFENLLKRLNEVNGLNDGEEDGKGKKRAIVEDNVDVSKKQKKTKTSNEPAIAASKSATPRPMLYACLALMQSFSN